MNKFGSSRHIRNTMIKQKKLLTFLDVRMMSEYLGLVSDTWTSMVCTSFKGMTSLVWAPP